MSCPGCDRTFRTAEDYRNHLPCDNGIPDGKPTNPKDRAAISRLDLSLVPPTAIAYMALASTEGDLKYGGYNWRDAGVKASVYVAACMRHLWKWYLGQECDPKTQVPHLASVLQSIAIIVDAYECGKLVDDRPPVHNDMAALLDRFEGIVKHLQGLFQNGPERHTEKK